MPVVSASPAVIESRQAIIEPSEYGNDFQRYAVKDSPVSVPAPSHAETKGRLAGIVGAVVVAVVLGFTLYYVVRYLL